MRRITNWGSVLGLAVGMAAALLLLHPRHARGAGTSRVVSAASVSEKVVALTFDDGPHPVFTPKLLDILDRYHAKATFFMIGEQVERYPEVAREVARRGHAIGNHTYSHPYDLRRRTAAQIGQELQACEADIERFAGVHTHLFRPPRGWADHTVLTEAGDEGLETILWSICADHRDAPTPEEMAARVIRRVRPGWIVLLHDGTINTRIKDVEATPLILEGLKKQGYRFVTIPELLELSDASARNHTGLSFLQRARPARNATR